MMLKGEFVQADFARHLERELAELRKNTSELIVSLQEEMGGVERELAAKDAHADEIYKASVGLANMLECKLERERALADRLAESLDRTLQLVAESGDSPPEAEIDLAAWKEARSGTV